MNVANCYRVLTAVLTLVLLHQNLAAQRANLPFRKSQSQTKEDFNLTRSDGPWLIMCASFGGEHGIADAKQLARELRRLKLKSHIFRHKFERPNVIEGIGWENYVDNMGQERHRPKTMRHASAQFEEIAVVVGDFPSVDDARAQQLLEQLKKFQPQSLAESLEAPSSQRLRNWREFARRTSSAAENKEKGPLRAAFLMPNPLLPDEYFDEIRVDHFVFDLNKKVRYSLLDNPSAYSVKVASFRGTATFELNEIEKQKRELNLLKRMGKGIRESKLAEAMVKANKLTVELRKLGVDAYEFHDRTESYVCVGGFDWVTQGKGASQKFNPDVARVIEKFQGKAVNIPNRQGAVQPKQLKQFRKTDIVFDVQPLPVPVPKMPVQASQRWR